jgi:dTDP-4-amino-4,6-dideoxygalactose transaminase
MQIKFNDLSKVFDHNKKEFTKNFLSISKQGSFIFGKELYNFEKNFAKFNGTNYCLGVSNGTDAIYLALRCLNLKKDDEVLVPSHTFIASILPVMALELKIKFVDVNLETYNLDIKDLQKKISKKTKALIVVHLYGAAVDVNEIKSKIPKKIKIIEDCSQAHGAKVGDKRVGSLGDFGCFSFYPGKNLGAFGDGGAILTNNKKYYEKIFLYRNWGSKKKYIHETFGWNCRLDTIQAAILNTKLRSLDKFNKKRFAIAKLYDSKINNKKIIKPLIPKIGTHVFHLYVIRVENRKKVVDLLNKNKIPSIIHYPRPGHMHKVVRNYKKKTTKNLSNTIKIKDKILSLPMHPFLNTSEVLKICKVLNNYS